MMFFISLVLAGSAFASTVFASDIRQLPYSYSWEFSESTAQPAFVVCDHCPPIKPLKAEPPVSRNIVPAPEHIQLALVTKEVKEKKVKSLSLSVSKAASQAEAPKIIFFPLTIYFDFDSYVLRPPEKEKLKDAFSHLDHLKGPVSVTGYTDDIGTRAYNMRLSTERASAVAEYLKKLGVVPAIVVGKGECCPVSTIKKLNRRVEIKEVATR